MSTINKLILNYKKKGENMRKGGILMNTILNLKAKEKTTLLSLMTAKLPSWSVRTAN